MPDSTYRSCVAVPLVQPTYDSTCIVDSSIDVFICLDRSHTGMQYSAVDKQSAIAVVLMVGGFAPHVVPVSFCRILFLLLIFIFVFLQCSLNVSDLSNVTPR